MSMFVLSKMFHPDIDGTCTLRSLVVLMSRPVKHSGKLVDTSCNSELLQGKDSDGDLKLVLS